ncbi:hypothetical protein ACOQFO_09005 [Ureibacillus sp. MALMAid1270]|uniref:hypothetical protein n=1 Tax=Ureibacillus sp. MALMAid1270 TaxID=3411629 RepID=UPI003BA42950
MSLLKSIKVPLTELQKEKIKVIDEFDYNPIKTKFKEEFLDLTDRYLSDGIENLKRYYVVALLDPENMHAVSNYVDPFWHIHLVFTKEYHAFCNEVFGQYIHHSPLQRENREMVNHVRALYKYTREIYDEIFTSVDDNWWPAAESATEICYHYPVFSEDILRDAVFPKKPELLPTYAV